MRQVLALCVATICACGGGAVSTTTIAGSYNVNETVTLSGDASGTQTSSGTLPITSSTVGDTAAAEGGLVTATLISNAVAAAFNDFVPGI